MKIISFALLMMLGIGAMAQTKYEVSKDPKNGRVVFKGPVTFDDLSADASFTWLKSGTDAYKPKRRNISYLRGHLENYTLIVFMGTWCSDSHDMIPKLLKILQETGYPLSQVTMYGVEREKATRSEETKKYNITLVPTIVVLKDGVEQGRIIETAQKSVEADLVEIISP